MKTHCLLALCALLAGTVTASPILNVIDRIARVHGEGIHDDIITTMREIEITNRNVDQWLTTFKDLNKKYVERIDGKDLTKETPAVDPFVCTEHESLAEQLNKIIQQWGKAWAGWQAKHELLELIWDLLTKKEDTKDKAGLHCGSGSGKQDKDAKELCEMLEGLRKTSIKEEALLKDEKKTLDEHKTNLDNYKCDCTFGDWLSEFGQCEKGNVTDAIIYPKDCDVQQKASLGKKNCKAIRSQCGEGKKEKQRKLKWNRKQGDAKEPGKKCEVGKTEEGVLSAVGQDDLQTLTADCKAGEYDGKCPINCEWSAWSDGGIVTNANCPARSCADKDAKQIIRRKKKTERKYGGKYCFRDENDHYDQISHACSYETTVTQEKMEINDEKNKYEALVKEIKKEMCKDGTGPCRNGAKCEVQLDTDNTKVTSWCTCETGFTGNFCEKVICKCDNKAPNGVETNGYTCSDGYKAHCTKDATCYNMEGFVKGLWADGCRDK